MPAHFKLKLNISVYMGFSGDSAVKNLPANAGDVGSIPGSGKSPGEEHGNPRQCSCLENIMDKGAWRATVHGVRGTQTRLKQWITHTHSHTPML